MSFLSNTQYCFYDNKQSQSKKYCVAVTPCTQNILCNHNHIQAYNYTNKRPNTITQTNNRTQLHKQQLVIAEQEHIVALKCNLEEVRNAQDQRRKEDEVRMRMREEGGRRFWARAEWLKE